MSIANKLAPLAHRFIFAVSLLLWNCPLRADTRLELHNVGTTDIPVNSILQTFVSWDGGAIDPSHPTWLNNGLLRTDETVCLVSWQNPTTPSGYTYILYDLTVGSVDYGLFRVTAGATLTVPVKNDDGIAGWWPAEGSATDIVSENNGRLVGDIDFESGEAGQAFSLDGSSTYISIPASPGLDIGGGTGSTGITIEGWISPGSITMEYSAPILEWDSGSAIGVQFWTADNLWANIVDTDGYDHVMSSDYDLITEDILQHVALTYDQSSGTGKFYLNGVVVTAENLGSFVPQTTYDMNIGRRTGDVIGSGYNFHGLIDELGIYKRALSAGEIQAIYNRGSAGKVDTKPCTPVPSDIAAWWAAEDDASDVVNGNDGTLVEDVDFVGGETGKAFSLDGSSTYISVPASSSLDIGGATGSTGITIEGWISPGSMTMEWSAPIVEWDSGSAIGVQFWTADNLWANIVDTDGYDHVMSSDYDLITEGILQHVAVTYDQSSGTAKFFRNGIAVTTENLGSFVPQTTYDLNIGRRTGEVIGSGYNFHGLIDELSIYKRALSSEEIEAIYKAGSAGKCR